LKVAQETAQVVLNELRQLDGDDARCEARCEAIWSGLQTIYTYIALATGDDSCDLKVASYLWRRAIQNPYRSPEKLREAAEKVSRLVISQLREYSIDLNCSSKTK
jgi:hypothetical protein